MSFGTVTQFCGWLWYWKLLHLVSLWGTQTKAVVQRLLLLVEFLWTVALTVWSLLWLQSHFGHTSCLFSDFQYSKCLFCHLLLMCEIGVLFFTILLLRDWLTECLSLFKGGKSFLAQNAHKLIMRKQCCAECGVRMWFSCLFGVFLVPSLLTLHTPACLQGLSCMHWCCPVVFSVSLQNSTVQMFTTFPLSTINPGIKESFSYSIFSPESSFLSFMSY